MSNDSKLGCTQVIIFAVYADYECKCTMIDFLSIEYLP